MYINAHEVWNYSTIYHSHITMASGFFPTWMSISCRMLFVYFQSLCTKYSHQWVLDYSSSTISHLLLAQQVSFDGAFIEDSYINCVFLRMYLVMPAIITCNTTNLTSLKWPVLDRRCFTSSSLLSFPIRSSTMLPLLASSFSQQCFNVPYSESFDLVKNAENYREISICTVCNNEKTPTVLLQGNIQERR